MPDVLCPNCANLIRLPQSYSWYDGVVPCSRCQSSLKVRLGDYFDGMYPVTRPFPGSQGGLNLITPEIIKTGLTVPLELVQGIESERIAYIPREAMRSAIRHCNNLKYEDAVVRCRVTIEAALQDLGTSKDSPGRMVDKAIEDRLLTEPYGKLCQAVTSWGGQAAHPSVPPIGQAEALIVIGITAAVLRTLYPVDD